MPEKFEKKKVLLNFWPLCLRLPFSDLPFKKCPVGVTMTWSATPAHTLTTNRCLGARGSNHDPPAI